jgi:hypothetical protein
MKYYATSTPKDEKFVLTKDTCVLVSSDSFNGIYEMSWEPIEHLIENLTIIEDYIAFDSIYDAKMCVKYISTIHSLKNFTTNIISEAEILAVIL